MHPDPHSRHTPGDHDPITGLANRSQALRRLEEVLRTTRRHRTFTALLLVDLDGWRKINETHGRAAADQVLREVAGRLTDSIRARDLVARSGDNEFMIVLDGLGAPLIAAAGHALQIAEKLRLSIGGHAPDTPATLPGLTASVGLTLMRASTASTETALHEAQDALHRIREGGGNQVRFHDPELQAEAERRRWLEHDLLQALDAPPQISLRLQPQIGASGKVTGAELLAHWQHPLRGDVPPSQFIPLAEETGWINQLGLWSLRAACTAAATLQGLGESYPLSVNVSPNRLMNPGFVASVRDTLESTGTPGSRLIFEVTEGLLIQDTHTVVERMQALVRLGIRFSIDDFGTGYSNLASLRRLPLHELKIDRSLVQDLPGSEQSAAIVQLILGMASRLGLRVVAEGVERQDQADFLFAHHCDALQGFLLAQPMTLSAWFDQVRAHGRSFPPSLPPDS